MATSSNSSSTTAVTLPPALAFLVSNFHSLVTVRLDRSNYLLWRVQVENVMTANGFFEYLDGTIESPLPAITNNDGVTSTNPEFLIWKLIDNQLLACLTASLSPSTLPYVLGLKHARQVWDSLSNRYNSLSKNHVQDLRCKLYNLSKTSTMESYIDTVKEYAQKLEAAGSPMNEEDLIFHLLRGLPKVFNGFKTAIGTRGGSISFDEVVTMLNSEDLQLLQENAPDSDVSTVLVAQHGNVSGSGTSNVQNGLPLQPLQSFMSVPSGVPMSTYQYGVSQPPLQMNVTIPSQSQYGSSPHFGQSSQQQLAQSSFVPQQQSNQQQFYPQQNRNNNRGRGSRGNRFPREPCAICGRTNHITDFCYYKNQTPSQAPAPHPSYQVTAPPTSFQVPYPTGFPPWVPTPWLYPQAIPMYLPSVNAGFRGSSTQGQSPSLLGTNGQFGLSTSAGASPSAQAHFTGVCDMPSISSSQNMTCMSSGQQPYPSNYTAAVTNPINAPQWYFDSGATHHITNNLQNLDISQPATHADGVMVGNGSNVQVTHTGQGQGNPTNTVPGTLSQGTLPNSELL